MTYLECDACYNNPTPWMVTGHETDCQWHDPFDDVWTDAQDKDETMIDYSTSGTTIVLGAKASSFQSKWAYCSHALDRYELSDGTPVFLSAWDDRLERTWEPDLGIYLDNGWIPRTIAYSIGWQDYGLSFLADEQVLEVAREALDKARAGKLIEVGCWGGHGRTGTFVAMLDMLSMNQPDAKLAISRIRSLHCRQCIESDKQEWWLECIECLLTGRPAPAPLPVKTWPHSVASITSKGKDVFQHSGQGNLLAEKCGRANRIGEVCVLAPNHAKKQCLYRKPVDRRHGGKAKGWSVNPNNYD